MSAGDYRTQTGIGVLLARFRLYDDAIQHFQTALNVDPTSDDVKFDLADAYFRKGDYAQALETAKQVSAPGQQDSAYLSLLGDIQAHLGDTADASSIFRDAITQNPDNDQYYLSLALVELRENNIPAAEDTLQKGLARIPSSGKIFWGLGIASVLDGKTPQAEAGFQARRGPSSRMVRKLFHPGRFLLSDRTKSLKRAKSWIASKAATPPAASM